MLQDSVNRLDGTHPFLLPALFYCFNYSFYRFQMTLETIRFFESPSFTFSNSLSCSLLGHRLFRPESYPGNANEDTVKDPNGTDKWQGSGIAYRSRHRSHTFGSPGAGTEVEFAPADTFKEEANWPGCQDFDFPPQKTPFSRQSPADRLPLVPVQVRQMRRT